MRSLTNLLVPVLFVASGSLTFAQQTEPANNAASPSAGATKAEVEQLRQEVAAQRQTIEELKALVEKMAANQEAANREAANQEKTAAAMKSDVQITPVSENQVSENPADTRWQQAAAFSESSARLTNAVLREEDGMPEAMVEQGQAAAAAKKDAGPPITAGWSGEHFFIRSADGQFSISPYGYLNTDYRAYQGDGAPSDSFLIRRARFGFQGNYGSHFDFALLTDANSTTGAIVRDAYVNIRVRPEFQFQAGQFKEPFAQETGIGATNLDFVERGFQALLYPCASAAYRCPGVTLHGDLSGGVVQWWAGAFNGRGGVTNNVTNEPEFVGRLRFYPFRKGKNELLKQFAFGGSITHSRSRGLSGDTSFSGSIPDAAYNFFPALRINGPVERYEGEFTYIEGPLALRGEYVQQQEQRWGVGSETVDGLGFFTIPGIGAKAWNAGGTYLLTGEKRPENGTPRVKKAMFGPDTPGGKGRGWGAWEVGLRYTGIQANAPGANFPNPFTPGFVPTYDFHTDEVTFGINWYPNYWVKYMVNVGIDQLHQPSVTGQVPQNFFVVLQRLQFRF